MATLLECDGCGTRSWNMTPNTELSLMQSILVLENGKCPICGKLIGGDLVGENVKPAFFEKRLLGPPHVPPFEPRRIAVGRQRPDHYLFAHRVLPQAAFVNVAYLFAMLHESKPGPRTMVEDFLGMIWKDYPDERSVDADEVVLDHYRVSHPSNPGGTPCLLFRMPQPHFAAEAYFVAFVLMYGDGDDFEQKVMNADVLCMTLEAAQPEHSPSGTIIGRWAPSESEQLGRRQYGPGPRPEAEAFVQCVERLVCLEPHFRI